jgi:K+-sensing histidine kinase KdpD
MARLRRHVHQSNTDNLALIHVDAVLLQQVMENLLDNADKYSPAGLPSTFRLKPHRSVYTTCKQIASKNAVLQHSG